MSEQKDILLFFNLEFDFKSFVFLMETQLAEELLLIFLTHFIHDFGKSYF